MMFASYTRYTRLMSEKKFSARFIYASLISRECRYTGCLSAPLPKQVLRFVRKKKSTKCPCSHGLYPGKLLILVF